MATTTACEPKLRPTAPINDGSAIAAEFTLILSAPASKSAAASSAVRTPPPDGERNKNLARCAGHRVEQRLASLVRRRNVQQDNLVRAGCRVPMRQLRRIARIQQIDEANSLHHTARRHIETGNDALGQHSRHRQKVAQHLQPRLARFLRMELHAEEIPALHRAAERAGILRHANCLVHHRRAIAVRVIHKRLRRQTGKQPRLRRRF